VLGPLNSLVWWEVPLGYIALRSFLFLQEQIKDIIVRGVGDTATGSHVGFRYNKVVTGTRLLAESRSARFISCWYSVKFIQSEKMDSCIASCMTHSSPLFTRCPHHCQCLLRVVNSGPLLKKFPNKDFINIKKIKILFQTK
jgi:hypothetical protein